MSQTDKDKNACSDKDRDNKPSKEEIDAAKKEKETIVKTQQTVKK